MQCKASVLVLVAWQKGPLIHLGQESQLVYMVAGDGMAALFGIGATDHGLAVVADAEEHTTPGMIEDMEVPVGRACSPSRSRWIRPCRKQPRVESAAGAMAVPRSFGALPSAFPSPSAAADGMTRIAKRVNQARTIDRPLSQSSRASTPWSCFHHCRTAASRLGGPAFWRSRRHPPPPTHAPPSQRPIASPRQPRQRLDHSPFSRLQRPFEVAGPAG